MTNEQINITIAQACGWTELNNDPDWGWLGRPPNWIGKAWPILDYCNDLNAMHEAEMRLDTDALFERYYLALYDSTGSTRWPVCATARQRAEAFLRAIGKWKEVAK